MKIKTAIQGYLGAIFLVTVLIVFLFVDMGVKNIVTDKVGNVYLQLTQHNGESIEKRLLSYQKAVNSIVIDRFIVNGFLQYDQMTALERVDTEIAITQSIRPILMFEDGIRTVGYWMNNGVVKQFGEEGVGVGDEELRYSYYFRKNYANHPPEASSLATNYVEIHLGLNDKYYRLYFTQNIVDYNKNRSIGGVFIVVDTSRLFGDVLNSETDHDESHFLLDDENVILIAEEQARIGKQFNRSILEQISEKKGIIETENSIITYYRLQNNYLLVNSYSKESIKMEINKLRFYIVLILLLCLCIVLFIGYFAGKYIDRRFLTLHQLINRLEVGDFSMSLKRIQSPTNEFDDVLNRFFIMASKVKKLIEEIYISELDKREAELNALQYQINPHFLFNTLEIISAKARINKQPDIEQVSKTLGQLFRYNMNRDNKNVITIEDEISHINNYMMIQNMHHNQMIHIYVDVDEKYFKNAAIRFLMQPIIENCLFHGLKGASGGMIEISASEQGCVLRVDISDDGLGIEPEKVVLINANMQIIDKQNNSNIVGLGLRNVNRRLKLVFGEAYGLTICSQTIGTTVSILLPLQQHYEEGVL